MKQCKRVLDPLVTEAFDRTAEIVRRNDYDRFLTGLLVDHEHRAELMAFYAFNAELERILDSVTEPTLAAIRFQWWRDAVEDLTKNENDEHPAFVGLRHAVRNQQLSTDHLLDLVDTYELELDGVSHETWDDLDRYCDKRVGQVMAIALSLVKAPLEVQAIVEHAGRAWGIMSIVRTFPHYAGQGRLYLPAEAFADVDLDPHDALRGEGGMPLMGILLAAIGRAQDYLAMVRDGAPRIPKSVRPVLSYVGFVDLYAAQIRRHPAQPFALHPAIPSFQKQLKLFSRSLRGGI